MSGLGIANPAGAAALAAVAVLVALYLRDRRRQVIPVGTLFLWSRVPADRLAGRRFRRERLFLVQLAVLLALIGGYLRPYVSETAGSAGGRRVAIVLDVSASMQAREAEGTRFELARRRARARVATLGSADEVMLVAAGMRARIWLRWTADHARVADRLEVLEPADTPGDLAAAVELALGEARLRPETRTVVLTDLSPETSGVGAEAVAAVDWIQVGRTDDNVGIIALRVDHPPFQGLHAVTATAVVRNYAAGPRPVILEARLGAAVWERRELVLAARGAQSVLLAHPPAAGPLEVGLLGHDALSVDDRAFGRIAPEGSQDILLVSDTPELAPALAQVTHRHVSSQRYADYAAAPDPGPRTLVLDRVAPESPRGARALYLEPPPGSGICPSAGSAEEAAVVDWEPAHATLAGLGPLHALDVPRARQLEVPPWSTPVVLAAAGGRAFPLLVAGEPEGRRVACLGATLTMPLASTDQLGVVLLILGVLRWLEDPPGPPALAVLTGRAVEVGGGGEVEAEGPGLRVAGTTPVVVAERTGFHRLRTAAGQQLVVANLFDDRESDIARSGEGERPARLPAPLAPARAGGREIGWWLYALGALLLALEWLLWRRESSA